MSKEIHPEFSLGVYPVVKNIALSISIVMLALLSAASIFTSTAYADETDCFISERYYPEARADGMTYMVWYRSILCVNGHFTEMWDDLYSTPTASATATASASASANASASATASATAPASACPTAIAMSPVPRSQAELMTLVCASAGVTGSSYHEPNGWELYFFNGGGSVTLVGSLCVDWDPATSFITGTQGLDYDVYQNLSEQWQRIQVYPGRMITWRGNQLSMYWYRCAPVPGTVPNQTVSIDVTTSAGPGTPPSAPVIATGNATANANANANVAVTAGNLGIPPIAPASGPDVVIVQQPSVPNAYGTFPDNHRQTGQPPRPQQPNQPQQPAGCPVFAGVQLEPLSDGGCKLTPRPAVTGQVPNGYRTSYWNGTTTVPASSGATITTGEATFYRQ